MLKFANDTRLPLEEREGFKKCDRSFLNHLEALSKSARFGKWTLEIEDPKALYDVGPYAPNVEMASRIIDELMPNLKNRFENLYTPMRDRLQKTVTNHKIIIRTDPNAPSACTTTFSDGNMIFRVKEFGLLSEWGSDMLMQLELHQTSGGSMSSELGVSLSSSLKNGTPNSPEEAVQTILKMGAADKPLTKTDDFPLLICVGWWKPKVAKLLLDGGANVNIRDSNQRTPLLLACYLASESNLTDCLNYLPMIELLLTRPDVDVNARDKLDRTPLMYLALTGRFKGIDRLLDDPRVDVNLENRKMQTALDFAQQYKNEWLVKVLTSRKGEKKTVPPPPPSVPKAPLAPAVKKTIQNTSTRPPYPPAPPTAPVPKTSAALPKSSTVTTSPPTNSTKSQRATKIIKDLLQAHCKF